MSAYELIAPAGAFDRWPAGMQQDLEINRMSPLVGSTLVSETDELRVWHLLIPAGKRCSFHRHVLDYFWTCHTHGRARGYYRTATSRSRRTSPAIPGISSMARASISCTPSKTSARPIYCSRRWSSSKAEICRCRCRMRCD